MRRNPALTRGTHVTSRARDKSFDKPTACALCGSRVGPFEGLVDAGWCTRCGKKGKQ